MKGLLLIAALVAGALSGPATVQDAELILRPTVTAQLLAGIAPAPGDPLVERLAALEGWKEQRRWMEAQWSQVRQRISAIEQWRAREVRMHEAHNKTLLYPFSGPDFLNAYALAPDHARYIFFGLERPGNLPTLESLTDQAFVELLQDARGALAGMFRRNYFITSNMITELATPRITGTIPVIATMMALMNLRIVKIESVDLFPELTRAYETPGANRPRKLLRGARLEFVNPRRGAPQQLYYFSLDATDRALEFYPGFLDWMGRNQPATALLKSASYLLHDNQFSKTRAMLLASADVVIQDDTGIPYRMLARSPWQVRLYGKYARPIEPLQYGYQPDLEAAYEARPETPVLPFSFGYHWGSQQSGLLIATRESN
ncbi:MAG: hypothetical protein A3F90_11710 [Deltaproteobacteria bacterium RIFCSPLOWO2_12_FULL_60_19]|nr:MAG: hypothetical protein A3F90_11710 [Deltaproteobacteria bacterium RIFCSPLOWO2_12_FULL_60_19]